MLRRVTSVEHREMWVASGQDWRFTDELTIEATYRWLLRPQSVGGDSVVGDQLVAGPAVAGPAVANARGLTFRVTTARGSREVPEIRRGILREMLENDDGSLGALAAAVLADASISGSHAPRTPIVLLREREVRSPATFSVTFSSNFTPNTVRPLFRLLSFLPVSHIRLGLTGTPSQLRKTRLTFPRFANADLVVVWIRVDWGFITQSLKESLAMHRRNDRVRIHELRLDHYRRAVTTASSDLLVLEGLVTKGLETVRAGRRLRKRQLASIRELTSIVETHRSEPTPADVEDRMRELRERLEGSPLDLAVPMPLDREDGHISFPLATSDKHAVTSVVAPFTTEREPSTQGKRSAVLLLILGLVLAGTAMFDSSWLPFGANEPSVHSVEAFSSPLAALLLIFPSFLYAQYYQTRPRTDIGNLSQISTFALISLLFLAPVVPLIMVIDRVHTREVSFTLLGLGATSLAGAGLVWYSQRKRSLERLRQRACVSIVRAGPLRTESARAAV